MAFILGPVCIGSIITVCTSCPVVSKDTFWFLNFAEFSAKSHQLH